MMLFQVYGRPGWRGWLAMAVFLAVVIAIALAVALFAIGIAIVLVPALAVASAIFYLLPKGKTRARRTRERDIIEGRYEVLSSRDRDGDR